MIEQEFKLMRYRDAGMHTYTYFWINKEERIISPYFDDERSAHEWLSENFRNEND